MPVRSGEPDDAALWADLQARIARANALQRRIRRLQQSDIGSVNYQLEQLRLQERAIALGRSNAETGAIERRRPLMDRAVSILTAWGYRRTLLANAGCRVKPDNIVQIPNWLVEACISSAPSRITIYNRLGRAAMHLEGNKTYFGLGGMEMQFNVVSADVLRKAQEKPEDYRDLVVRIAGFSAYFVEMYKASQDDIIRRTEFNL